MKHHKTRHSPAYLVTIGLYLRDGSMRNTWFPLLRSGHGTLKPFPDSLSDQWAGVGTSRPTQQQGPAPLAEDHPAGPQREASAGMSSSAADWKAC